MKKDQPLSKEVGLVKKDQSSSDEDRAPKRVRRQRKEDKMII